MKCKIDSVNMINMSAGFVTKTGGKLVVPIGGIQVEELLSCLSSHKAPTVEVKYCGGDEFDIQLCEEAEDAAPADEMPEQQKPLTKKQLSTLGARLSSLSAILADRGIIPDDLPTLRKSSIVSSFVMPALEAAGVMTPIHERVDNHGERRKVRYFTRTGGRYGFTKKFLLDASGKKTISRNHVFYSHKADELIKLIGDDVIAKIKESCQ